MLAWKQLFIQRVRNSSLVERIRMDDERASITPPKLRHPEGWVGEHCGQRRMRTGRSAGASGKENVGISNEMRGEPRTPKTQGFLSDVRRLRVSRDLTETREGYRMDKRLIFRYRLHREPRDRGVTLPPADGIAG